MVFSTKTLQGAATSVLSLGVHTRKMSAAPENPDAQGEKDGTARGSAVQPRDPKGGDESLKVLYDELRRLAAFKMSQQPPGHTLQPTALVHEAWLKLAGTGHPTFENRKHFFALAADAMRCILIDRARRKQTERHGGGLARVPLDEFEIVAPLSDEQLLRVNDALEQFAREYPVQAQVVKLRFFVGITNEEIAEQLNISVSTVKNYWNFSRAWLFQAMEGR